MMAPPATAPGSIGGFRKGREGAEPLQHHPNKNASILKHLHPGRRSNQHDEQQQQQQQHSAQQGGEPQVQWEPQDSGGDAVALRPFSSNNRRAAQRLTNFRAYLSKSSVAACFGDLAEMVDEGLITESGLYPSNLDKERNEMRKTIMSSNSPTLRASSRVGGRKGNRGNSARPRGRTAPPGGGGGAVRGGDNPVGGRATAPAAAGGRGRNMQLDLAQVNNRPGTTHGSSRPHQPSPPRGALPGRPRTSGAVGAGRTVEAPANITAAKRAVVQRGGSLSAEMSTGSGGHGSKAHPQKSKSRGARNSNGGVIVVEQGWMTMQQPPGAKRLSRGGGGGGGGGEGGGGGGGGKGGGRGGLSRGATGGVQGQGTGRLAEERGLEPEAEGVGKGHMNVSFPVLAPSSACASGLGQNEQQQGQKQPQQPSFSPQASPQQLGARPATAAGGAAAGGAAGGTITSSSSTLTSRSSSRKGPRPGGGASGSNLSSNTSSTCGLVPLQTARRRQTSKGSSCTEEKVRKVREAKLLLEQAEEDKKRSALVKNDLRRGLADLDRQRVEAQTLGILSVVIGLAMSTWRVREAECRRKAAEDARIHKAITVLQRAWKLFFSRRMLGLLVHFKRVQTHFVLCLRIRRKRKAVRIAKAFLAECEKNRSGPSTVVKHYLLQIRRCQRIVREWLICRRARAEIVLRHWDKIEAVVRKEFLLQAAKQQARLERHMIKSKVDDQIVNQWTELQGKTRALYTKLDRINTRIERNRENNPPDWPTGGSGGSSGRLTWSQDGAEAAAAAAVGGGGGAGGGGRPLSGTISRESGKVWSSQGNTVGRSSSSESILCRFLGTNRKKAGILMEELRLKFGLFTRLGASSKSARVVGGGPVKIDARDALALITGDAAATEELLAQSVGLGTKSSARKVKVVPLILTSTDLGRPWRDIVVETLRMEFDSAQTRATFV